MGEARSGERVADRDDDREKPGGLAYSVYVRWMISQGEVMHGKMFEDWMWWSCRPSNFGRMHKRTRRRSHIQLSQQFQIILGPPKWPFQETPPLLFFHDSELHSQRRSAKKGHLHFPLAHPHLPFTIVLALVHLGSGGGNTYTRIAQCIEGCCGTLQGCAVMRTRCRGDSWSSIHPY